jgi:hypothetical protein
VDRRGTLWVATDGLGFGFNRDSIRVNTILKLARNGKSFEGTAQPVGFVAQLAEAPDGEIWMAEASGPGPTVRGVHERSGPDVEREVQTTPSCVLFDRRSSVWIGLFRGGIRRATDFRHLEQTTFERRRSCSVSGPRRQHLVWDEQGLDRFRENKATPFTTREGLIKTPRVALSSTADGTVWIINYPQDPV